MEETCILHEIGGQLCLVHILQLFTTLVYVMPRPDPISRASTKWAVSALKTFIMNAPILAMTSQNQACHKLTRDHRLN